MALMNWTEENYGTGIGFADDQHKVIFSCLNDVHEVAGADDKAAIGANMDALIKSVVEHFSAEDDVMKAKGFEGYAAHKEIHDELIGICADLKTSFDAGDAEIDQSFTRLVKAWLNNHIPNVDRLYTSALS